MSKMRPLLRGNVLPNQPYWFNIYDSGEGYYNVGSLLLSHEQSVKAGIENARHNSPYHKLLYRICIRPKVQP